MDTSAVLAILFGEADAPRCAEALAAADRCRMSVVGFVETAIIIDREAGPLGGRELEALLRRVGMAIEPATVEQAHLARQAYADYGKDNHPAGLNFGDCFAYALAKATGEPLLFKGDDFSRTDVAVA